MLLALSAVERRECLLRVAYALDSLRGVFPREAKAAAACVSFRGFSFLIFYCGGSGRGLVPQADGLVVKLYIYTGERSSYPAPDDRSAKRW